MTWRNFTFAAAVCLSGCGGFGLDEPEGAIALVPETPTYSDHIALVMERACDQCHGGARDLTPGFVTTRYESVGSEVGVFDGLDLIIQRSVDQAPSPMPPVSEPPLTDIEIETLLLWRDQGAPE